MAETEKLICGDCKGTNIFQTKRGSAIIEKLLFVTLFFPGIIYGMWRNHKPKRFCQYCDSEFLLPDSYETREMLKPIEKKHDHNL
jgi:hypothetical protein